MSCEYFSFFKLKANTDLYNDCTFKDVFFKT